MSQLENTHCYLPDKERSALYEKLTVKFCIESDENNNFVVNGLSSPNIGSITTYQSLREQIETIIYYFIITAFFFVPIIFLIYTLYLLYLSYYYQVIINIMIYSFLSFYPIEENKSILLNKWVFNQLKYFSYRLCCSDDTNKFMLNKHSNLIFMNIPHGALPLTTVISPLIMTQIWNGNEPIATAASIIFYIPIIRNFAYWFGAKSVSKSSMKYILLNLKRCVGIVSDGISGIFVQKLYDNSKEVVLLKHRKGIAKLALQCGVEGVVCCYGFGNCQVFKCWFDSYGVLRSLSKMLRLSLIILYGRWYLWIPKRIALYNVIGPIVKNKYANNPIKNPSQQQIDQYHKEILNATKLLFNQHKQIYGWKDKELIFV